MIFTKQYDCLNELNKGLYSDLILVESDYTDEKKVLAKYGQEISKRYDIFIKDISFYRDHMNNVHSTNSKFIISSDKNRINVKYKDMHKCPQCAGGGLCSTCGGTGIVNETKSIKVKLPKEIK